MAQHQVASRHPDGATTQGGHRLPPIRILTANGVPVSHRRDPTDSNRASQWIVQVVILSTSAFAALDLYLLATSLNH